MNSPNSREVGSIPVLNYQFTRYRKTHARTETPTIVEDKLYSVIQVSLERSPGFKIPTVQVLQTISSCEVCFLNRSNTPF